MPCRTPGCASSARRRRKMVSGADRRLFWGTAAAVVIADVVTKLLAESLLARHLPVPVRSEEHTSELQSRSDLVCRLLLEKKKKHTFNRTYQTAPTHNT